ncbi:MAG: histidinol-phosphate transaminase [Nitrospiria bacterium]
MIKVSPDISKLIPYVPGISPEALEREMGISGAVKMASNENPLGPSKKAISAIRSHLKRINQYPSGTSQDLKDALAEKWKVLPEQVIIGNGSNEIIELLVRTFVMPGDEVVMAHPSFSLYDKMAKTAHAKTVHVALEDGRHDLKEMSKAVNEKTKLIFICNPNNPTGTIIHHEDVKKFLLSIPKTALVVLDEAYAEYVTHPNFPHAVTLLNEGASLIMLRTFSKIYGLAGLRIGYGLSGVEMIDYMNRVRQPFNANALGQQGALAALSDEIHIRRSRKVNREGKRYLFKMFEDMGISTYPSETNFIYFYLQNHRPDIGRAIHKALLQEGIIIRHFGGVHFRVTIGLMRDNRGFIRSLKTILSNIDPKAMIPDH